ncbi:MAG: deoxyribodipyrimidine photo-lyase [Xanthomonadales bacterium]|nr:deoxyribodipyrimidine photo-lyase [Xanthomonadales bacterium]NIT08777.1 deoxyribodipyrimidine photo-lyase [Xanthomonadales bacterium]
MAPVIVWFRRNLRLHDNLALHAAADTGRPVVPVYVSDDLDAGGASRWWLHHSLCGLDTALQEHGAGLVVRAGKPEQLLPGIVESTGAESVFFARRYEPRARSQEGALEKALDGRCEFCGFDDGVIRHPDSVMTRSGTPYKVFTPFWRAASGPGEPEKPVSIPGRFETTAASLDKGDIDGLQLLPTKPDWAGGLRETWTPGEGGAFERLDAACSIAGDYAELRDRPDLEGTSRLSPHLHFGELSPRQVWHDIRSATAAGGQQGADALLRQLYWRDFSAYLLYHFPHLPAEPLREEFREFPWTDDPQGLEAWQQGRTGFPIVDAGMRQLWATGWMHNRVRMLVASFLVKDLLVPWQAGAEWFLDTLVDADLANNSASWQWVAGCGTDAAPYFRIFNPVLQGKKFDPMGDYVRRWVPELERLPAKLIQEPWIASLDEQKAANVVIGEDYPGPIVNHGDARDLALEAYRAIRS